MRIRLLVPVAGLLLLSAASFAQTGVPPEPASAPQPAATVPSVPAPVPAAPGSIGTVGAYAQGTTQTQNIPVTAAGAPVVVPQSATASAPVVAMPPYEPYGIPDEDRRKHAYGSTYIPLDSWIYPEMQRLYSMGYASTMFLSMRPYTRQSLLHILEETEDDIRGSDNEEAKEIYTALVHEIRDEPMDTGDDRGFLYGTRAAYTRVMGITGTTLRDSYHLGQTIVNDYGRPYQPGFNDVSGLHEIAEYGRFSLDVRGEYQHSPAAAGYSFAVAQQISIDNGIPYSGGNLHQATIPSGPIAAQNPFRLMEASLSFFFAGHEISGGKSDAWQGPGYGGAMAWSNNAENIYSFRINRVEPLHIPLLSYILGPVRYEFFYGSLKGHSAPNDDWVHSEMISFRPTENVEFGFQRTIVFGGHGHEPVNLHTFLKGFFDINDTTPDEKNSRSDPGARFTAFNFSWRLPYIRRHATLYTDSEAHDDVTPPSAPRRAAYRVGLELSQIPKAPKFELRLEAADTDPPVLRSLNGTFNYYETVQQQAYTNQGFIMGDWVGREGKAYMGWLTYHLSGDEWIQLQYVNKKDAKDFIQGTVLNPLTGARGPGGTTQNQVKASIVKRFHHDDVELNAWFQYEGWKAPIYLPGKQNDTTTAVQLTFFPVLKKKNIH